VEDAGKLNNTLIIYISGDNGASLEGKLNGLYSEYPTSIQSGVESWVEVLTVAEVGRNGNVSGAVFLRCLVGERRMRTHTVIISPPSFKHDAGCFSDTNSVSLRHSSLRRPMKLSTNAFCCGLPGAM
jgi:hypothetical protein